MNKDKDSEATTVTGNNGYSFTFDTASEYALFGEIPGAAFHCAGCDKDFTVLAPRVHQWHPDPNKRRTLCLPCGICVAQDHGASPSGEAGQLLALGLWK